MKIFCVAAVLAACLAMAGCGGSGGSSSPAVPPSLTVSLSASSGSASVTEGATTATATVTASVVQTGTINTPVVTNLSYDNTVYSSVTAVAGAGGSYTVTATTQPNLGGATYVSPITFRLCQDAACNNVYAGSTATFTYTLSVNLRDWATFQRDATHTGYVHTTLDVTKFNKIWAWTNPAANFMTAVVSGNGSAYFSAAPGTVYSFNEATGAQNWAYTLATPTAINDPGALAYDSGTVYVPAFVTIPGGTFYGTGTVRGLDAATGAYKSDSPFVSQEGVFNSPVVQGGNLFYSAGYYGGVSYMYDLPSGTAVWTSTANVQSNEFAGETPAVDQNYVYYSTEEGVAIYNRADGSLYANVQDTRLWTGGFQDYIAPIIAPSGHIIVSDPQAGYEIIAVGVGSKSILWRTGTGYGVQPAMSGNVIYAARNPTTGGFTVDAISDTDGSVLWSWTMPSTDTKLIENMIVCDNLLFVSSDKNVYAINLSTHQTVWTYAAHGKLSLSSNYVLYIVANDYGVGGNVTAVKLVG